MNYRFDEDLEFLDDVSSEDLNDLVYALTKDKDGGKIFTEELTSSDAYKKYYPDHHRYWQSIAAELQRFGANTLVTKTFRFGKGVLYREILTEVAEKLKVEFDKKSAIENIEDKLLNKILLDALEKMTEEERKEFATSMGVSGLASFSSQATFAAFQAIFKAGGFKSYQLTLVVINAISKAMLGRGLSFAGNAALMRSASLLVGPIGWTITGLWTIKDIAGPAFRVTIPAVIQVAYLRKKIREDLEEAIREELEKKFEDDKQ